jgi:tRNA G18 (ribose-2'-O)-methylase SpoU
VKIDATIARDAAEQVEIVRRRSSPHALKELSGDGYQLVGLEQTTNSINIHEFQFSRKTVLVVGHERTGLPDEVLRILDHVVEIPVWGLPYSYNAATAVTMALYEYCRQFPRG